MSEQSRHHIENFMQRLARIVSIGIRNLGKLSRSRTIQFVRGYKMAREIDATSTFIKHMG